MEWNEKKKRSRKMEERFVNDNWFGNIVEANFDNENGNNTTKHKKKLNICCCRLMMCDQWKRTAAGI